jgi:pimeloyl-ACP methyl ester carboxylesterase
VAALSVDGADLVVESSGDGPPLVFVHGSNGGLDSWSAVGDVLPGHRIVRYARRNHPPSSPGDGVNSFAVEAADLLAVLGSLPSRAHVVGGSYGATVALHAARTDDSNMASLALFEPPLLLSGPHLRPILSEFRKLCAARCFGAALTLFLREVARVPDTVLAAGPPVPQDRAVAEPAARAALGDLEAMAADTTDVSRWSTISVPVLLMGGGLSWPPLPEGMDLLAGALPHASRLVLADQSHFATITAPSSLAAAMREFIATSARELPQ